MIDQGDIHVHRERDGDHDDQEDDDAYTYQIFDVNLIKGSLVAMHMNLCEMRYFDHDHSACTICSQNPRGCANIRKDIQDVLKTGSLCVI